MIIMAQNVTYTVEFVETNDITTKVKSKSVLNKDDEKEISNKNPKKNTDIVSRKGIIDKKTFGTFMTIYGTYNVGKEYYQNIQSSSYISRGDNLGAIIQRENYQMVDSAISTGINIAGGFLVFGPVGGAAAIVGESIRYAKQAINVSIQNKLELNQLKAERHVASLNQERFVRTSTTERLRR